MQSELEWSLTRGQTEAWLRLLAALVWPWEVRSHYRAMRSWFERLQSQPDVSNYPCAYARLLNHVGRQSWSLGNITYARSILEESLALWKDSGIPGEIGLAEAYNWLGLTYIGDEHNRREAAECFNISYHLFSKYHSPGAAVSQFHQGILDIEQGKLETAHSLLTSCLSIFKERGDTFFISRVSIFLAHLFLKLGELSQARQYIIQSLELDRQIHFWREIADNLIALGDIYRMQSDEDQAQACYAESRVISRDHGLDTRSMDSHIG
jgi:tetratricopeptide (TPR) repeat protein